MPPYSLLCSLQPPLFHTSPLIDAYLSLTPRHTYPFITSLISHFSSALFISISQLFHLVLSLNIRSKLSKKRSTFIYLFFQQLSYNLPDTFFHSFSSDVYFPSTSIPSHTVLSPFSPKQSPNTRLPFLSCTASLSPLRSPFLDSYLPALLISFRLLFPPFSCTHLKPQTHVLPFLFHRPKLFLLRVHSLQTVISYLSYTSLLACPPLFSATRLTHNPPVSSFPIIHNIPKTFPHLGFRFHTAVSCIILCLFTPFFLFFSYTFKDQ